MRSAATGVEGCTGVTVAIVRRGTVVSAAVQVWSVPAGYVCELVVFSLLYRFS